MRKARGNLANAANPTHQGKCCLAQTLVLLSRCVETKVQAVLVISAGPTKRGGKGGVGLCTWAAGIFGGLKCIFRDYAVPWWSTLGLICGVTQAG